MLTACSEAGGLCRENRKNSLKQGGLNMLGSRRQTETSGSGVFQGGWYFLLKFLPVPHPCPYQ